MGNGAGTMGMPFGSFVVMWTAMMAAMMFPSVAPVAILWTRSIVYRLSGLAALSRIALFVSGYLLAWAFAGVVAFFGLVLFERVLLLAGSNAGWLGAAIFVTAGVYQFTSFKDVCLRHCRSPMSLASATNRNLHRRSSAIDQAWNGQPVAPCGASPSAVSDTEPIPHSWR